jgi:hypothetical protein
MLRVSSSRLSTSLARHSTNVTTGARTYVTADIISTSETEPLPPSTAGLDSSRPQRRKLQPDSAATKSSSRQTVIVETSRPIQNMVEGFALLRALEQRFGPAQEFQFPRVRAFTVSPCFCTQHSRGLSRRTCTTPKPSSPRLQLTSIPRQT